MADDKHISDEALQGVLDYVLQKHTQASKGNRSHADFRFGNSDEGLESYAIPKGHLPEVKERLLAVNTEIHPYGYARFHGIYGKGRHRNAVEILESGKIGVNRDPDGSALLEIQKDGRRYKLVKTRNGKNDNWLLIGLPPAVGTKTASEKSCKFISGRFLDCRTVKNLANLLIIQPLTAKTLKKGLGGRSSLPFGLGMLFLNCRTFWMKDVPFDLELVRLDRNFEVTEIQKMRRSFFNLDLPVYRPKKTKSVHALEVPAGYCDAKGIKIGDLFRVKKGN
jgi:uncharacterized membrane protein (UPF0127 family)